MRALSRLPHGGLTARGDSPSTPSNDTREAPNGSPLVQGHQRRGAAVSQELRQRFRPAPSQASSPSPSSQPQQHLGHPRRRRAPPVPAPPLPRASSTASPQPSPPRPTTTSSSPPHRPCGIRAIVRRFWPLARPYRKPWAAGLVLAALLPAVEAAEIWLFKLVVDDVLVPADARAAGRAGRRDGRPRAARRARSPSATSTRPRGSANASRSRCGRRCFRHLQRLEPDALDKRRHGDVLQRLTGDLHAIETLLLNALAEAVQATARLLFFAGALFLLSWKLALASLIVSRRCTGRRRASAAWPAAPRASAAGAAAAWAPCSRRRWPTPRSCRPRTRRRASRSGCGARTRARSPPSSREPASPGSSRPSST